MAQADDLERLLTEVLPWSFALLAAVVVLMLAIKYYRRRFRAGDGGGDRLWTLQDLREMHARGDLADEEFERLKARVIAEMGAAEAPGGSGPMQAQDADPEGVRKEARSRAREDDTGRRQPPSGPQAGPG